MTSHAEKKIILTIPIKLVNIKTKLKTSVDIININTNKTALLIFKNIH